MGTVRITQHSKFFAQREPHQLGGKNFIQVVKKAAVSMAIPGEALLVPVHSDLPVC